MTFRAWYTSCLAAAAMAVMATAVMVTAAFGQTSPAKGKPGPPAAKGAAKGADPKAAEGDAAGAPESAGNLGDLLDLNKDGNITDDEVRKATEEFQKQANATKKTAQGEAILKAADTNKDGKVDADEAKAAAEKARQDRPRGRGGPGRGVETFAALDVNKDGKLTRKEYAELPKHLGPWGARMDQRRLAGMFADADTNKDNFLTQAEMEAASSRMFGRFGRGGDAPAKPQPSADDQLRERIKRQLSTLDRNRDGKLSEKEVAGNRDLKARFKQIDTDIDQFLSLEEVVDFYKSQQPAEKK